MALLTSCAVLFAALATVLAFSGQAQAIDYQRLGSFSLRPATGKIAADVIAASATTDAPCPAGTSTNANLTAVKVLQPGNPGTDLNAYSKPLAKGVKETRDLTTGPIDLPLISTANPPLVKATSLQTALRAWIPTGSLDGDYTLVLHCSFTGSKAVFIRKVRVTGEDWTQIDQVPATLALTTAPERPAVNEDFKLSAAVTPAGAAGTVEFKQGGTSLGTAPVTGGKAELSLKAPAVGGVTHYTADFTPTDPDAHSAAQAGKPVSVQYVVTVKDTDGKTLGTKPTLLIGQKVNITVQGLTPAAKAAVSLTNSTEKFTDATVNASGAVDGYVFTVPDKLPNGEQTLSLKEDGDATKVASFTFTSSDEVPDPEADLEVTDENGTALEDNPDLAPGQKVKITARGYTKDAKVKVTLADNEATFKDATANAEGTVEKYGFTVPEDIEDGDHTLTLAEDRTDGKSVAFAFTTGDDGDQSPAPDPSATEGTDSGGTDSGGTDSGGGTGGGDTGGSGSTGGSGGGGGSMASTGAQAGAIGLTALALVSAGAALVIHMRRKGLLVFGDDSPQHP